MIKIKSEINNIYLLLSISSDGWQIHCSPAYIIDFLDLELCSVTFTQSSKYMEVIYLFIY